MGRKTIFCLFSSFAGLGLFRNIRTPTIVLSTDSIIVYDISADTIRDSIGTKTFHCNSVRTRSRCSSSRHVYCNVACTRWNAMYLCRMYMLRVYLRLIKIEKLLFSFLISILTLFFFTKWSSSSKNLRNPLQ